MVRTLIILASLLCMASSAGPLAVDAYPPKQFAPLRGFASVRVRITVEHDPHNRGVSWAWSSSDFYSSSFLQLDGEHAPRTITRFLDHLDPGHYIFTAVISRTDGQVTRTTSFDILAGDEQ